VVGEFLCEHIYTIKKLLNWVAGLKKTGIYFKLLYTLYFWSITICVPSEDLFISISSSYVALIQISVLIKNLVLTFFTVNSRAREPSFWIFLL